MTTLAELPDEALLPDRALEIAHEVGDRLREPRRVADTARHAFAAAPPDLMLPGWQPASVLLGHAGVALLHTRRAARGDTAWAEVAHAHLAAAAAGVAGLGAAAAGDLILPARLHARDSGGYAKLLARSAAAHAAFTEAGARRLAARLARSGPGLSYLEYDAIAGLTRQGRLLLCAADAGHERSAQVLADVLGLLAGLARPVRVAGRDVPGWWCDPDRYVVPHDRHAFPRGDLNVGVAHGISGPLALLSLAGLAGHRVPGGPEAIRAITDWVLGKEHTDQWGTYWPGRVSYDEETGRTPVQAARTARAGWCYGATGIAGSLHLAGRALGDIAVQCRAADAVRAALRRPVPAAMERDPGLCHGRAGLVQAGLRMVEATGDPELWDGVDRAVRGLVDCFDESAAFGFRQYVETPGAVHEIESPALLDGAAGAALALASYADVRRGRALGPDAGAWDAALLMS
ncbi:lanthionine synthetase LanC family protein [Streptomyces sp. NPDC059002]|uniref:lanthionine synthetase LanC family protein n=1 Tax=Streptomyces sp. NPDC059002 TaxID=3346690 RepID=UPI0036C03973